MINMKVYEMVVISLKIKCCSKYDFCSTGSNYCSTGGKPNFGRFWQFLINAFFFFFIICCIYK